LLGGLKGIMLEVIKNLDVPAALAKSENKIKQEKIFTR
jgi:hypothetical protein